MKRWVGAIGRMVDFAFTEVRRRGWINDVAGFVGAAFVAYGLWEIYQPLCYIAVGSFLFYLAVTLNDNRRDQTT